MSIYHPVFKLRKQKWKQRELFNSKNWGLILPIEMEDIEIQRLHLGNLMYRPLVKVISNYPRYPHKLMEFIAPGTMPLFLIWWKEPKQLKPRTLKTDLRGDTCHYLQSILTNPNFGGMWHAILTCTERRRSVLVNSPKNYLRTW